MSPPLPADTAITMCGGGSFGWDPGEWTDDTSMAIAIAEVAASGADLCEDAAQDAIVARWEEWTRGAKDVGGHCCVERSRDLATGNSQVCASRA